MKILLSTSNNTVYIPFIVILIYDGLFVKIAAKVIISFNINAQKIRKKGNPYSFFGFFPLRVWRNEVFLQM